MIWIAWIREARGWAAFEILANSYEEAVTLAHQRFVGTQGWRSLQVEREPDRSAI